MKHLFALFLLTGIAFSTYSQLIPLTDGFPISENSVNDTLPEIVANKSGKILTTWKSRDKIYGQMFDQTGVREGVMNELASPGKILFYKLFADTSGGFIVIWADLGKNIYGQYLNQVGEKIATEFKIISGDANWAKVDFSVNRKGDASLVYLIYNGAYDETIYMLSFNLPLKTTPTETLVCHEDYQMILIENPKVFIDEKGNFLVNWVKTSFGSPSSTVTHNESLVITSDLNKKNVTQGYFDVEGMESGFAGSITVTETNKLRWGPFKANIISAEGVEDSLPVKYDTGASFPIWENQNPRIDIKNPSEFILTFSGFTPSNGLNKTLFVSSFYNGMADTIEIANTIEISDVPGIQTQFNSVLSGDLYTVVYIKNEKATVRFYKYNSIPTNISKESAEAESRLIYPEMFSDFLKVKESTEMNSFSLYSINGNKVAEIETDILSTDKILPGFYIGAVTLKNGEVKIQKLIKE